MQLGISKLLLHLKWPKQLGFRELMVEVQKVMQWAAEAPLMVLVVASNLEQVAKAKNEKFTLYLK